MDDLCKAKSGSGSVRAAGPLVSRRGFAALGGAAALAAGSGLAEAAALELNDSKETIATPQGAADARFVRPATGQHSGVVMWASANRIGAADMAAARKLAEQGFAVLVADLPLHRIVAKDLSGLHADQLINRDARALVAWLSKQEAVLPAEETAKSAVGLGNGYTLRSVSAARPYLSLASRAERMEAAQSARLFAVPKAAVGASPAKMAKLAESAHMAYRRTSLA